MKQRRLLMLVLTLFALSTSIVLTACALTLADHLPEETAAQKEAEEKKRRALRLYGPGSSLLVILAREISLSMFTQRQ